jgi:hypothetical protein
MVLCNPLPALTGDSGGGKLGRTSRRTPSLIGSADSEAGLAMRRKKRQSVAIALWVLSASARLNNCGAMDFGLGTLRGGRWFRIHDVIDALSCGGTSGGS